MVSHLCLQVKVLSLANNQLSGSVPYMPQLIVLDVSSNILVEPRFEAVPATLQLLYLAKNNLTGEMLQLGSSSSANMDLKLLDLSQNNLSGALPQNMPTNLSILDISSNAFAGTLPSSWSRLSNMAELRLDNNQFAGTLPKTWSAWGNNTGNSLQLSIKNTHLHGSMPRQWVQQFCLTIVKSSNALLLFQPIKFDIRIPTLLSHPPLTAGPLVQLPAQHASINVTLANKAYMFDYNDPGSPNASIAHAARNTALAWAIWNTVGTLLSATLTCIRLWQNPGPQGALFRCWTIITVLT